MSVLNEIQESLMNRAAEEENTAANQPADTENTPTAENNPAEAIDTVAETQENQPEKSDASTTAATAPEANNQNNQPEKTASNFANEELAEANAYLLKNPGKSYDDYKALKVPTSSINENDLIKSFLSEKEGKTESSIAYELKRLELKESDPDFDDDFEDLETLKLKAEREELIQKAREWRDGFVKEQLSFDGDSQNIQNAEQENQQPVKSIDEFLQDAKRVQEEYTQNYRTEIYKAVGEINEIPLNINGSEVLFVPDEDFRTEMRKGAEDVAGIGKEFFDEKGNITNASAFIKENTLWANPKTRQSMLDFMIEQAVLKDRVSRDKGQRNITLDATQPHSVEGNYDDGKVVDAMLARNRTSF